MKKRSELPVIGTIADADLVSTTDISAGTSGSTNVTFAQLAAYVKAKEDLVASTEVVTEAQVYAYSKRLALIFG